MDDNVLPNLWDRLALLDITCDVSFSTVRLRDEDGREHRRWAVIVQRRDDAEAFFRVTTASTSSALSMAVLEAERRGWSVAALPATDAKRT